jgi:hypothetical protein
MIGFFFFFFSEIKCHMIYPLPYTAVVCPTGRIFGSSCEFTCDNGTALNGHPHAKCEKSGEIVPYGRWTFMNNQPYCESTQFLDIRNNKVFKKSKFIIKMFL